MSFSSWSYWSTKSPQRKGCRHSLIGPLGVKWWTDTTMVLFFWPKCSTFGWNLDQMWPTVQAIIRNGTWGSHSSFCRSNVIGWCGPRLDQTNLIIEAFWLPFSTYLAGCVCKDWTVVLLQSDGSLCLNSTWVYFIEVWSSSRPKFMSKPS